VIKAKGVFLQYPEGTLALKKIDLRVEAGEAVFITGPSGSGKTSLLKLFMGIELPTAGSLEVLGQSIQKGKEAGITKLRRDIGPVFQEFRLVKGRTAIDNIMLSIRFFGFSSKQLKENAYEAIERVGLAHKALSPVEKLSWGECQRIAIARAFVRKPLLILADEPTGNLDKDNALKILELLTSLKSKSTAVIITTHATHLIEANEGARHITMTDGELIENEYMKGIMLK